MYQENANVISQEKVQGGYHVLTLRAPLMVSAVQPGQFVHVRVPHMEESLLRRPFSVYRAEGDQLRILYKGVGKGTRTMTFLQAGDTLDLIGPLGRGFPPLTVGRYPVLVAGGYGMAALYLLARQLPVKGVAFFGGRTAPDILCVPEFEALGWEVQVATEDGSLGESGRVTRLLDDWWATREPKADAVEAYACGPNGMLQAVAERAREHEWTAWVSVDRNMGCGVGACLTCVLKTHTPGGGWTWKRSCTEGPVFESREIVWEEETAPTS